ncbi:mucin TcMUCII [Trypanosoma cruzi]|uniref:Putative mucin TcMUCII n=1 Tax=Trypanosoma cruzi TaxID=5693 RepID=A0A2V2W572_TRYCR|nr:mucin TcMUCII [Trypanosoma cruzi cruzi]PBJ73635.1 mucin TcMUCII [Trypanosoma cruzi cruzi]PWV03142.1 putative mucin TcMUCII [Trypanosoma cruzi]PWV03257.1 putative mucin TcMUCII [Trypanosoma cruzi]RNF11138.1 mucin TcMUCII [Trypanosoma cruzi]
MMTCRLLCALLVLALCCCRFVCVTAAGSGVKEERSEKGSDLEDNQVEEPKQVTDQHSTSSSSPEEITVEGTEHTRNKAKHTLEKTVAVTGTTGSQSNLNKVQEQEDERSIEEQTENTKTATVNEKNKKAYAPNTTTTTTTTAPRTTTTTTTQAPSTTTAEAPTTTTRAPSRLRDVDGSLSSSAWVCTPLLLAASALAYTTLG